MKKSKHFTIGAAAIILMLLHYNISFAIDESIGIINDFKGTVHLVRNNQKVPIDKGFNLLIDDTLSTGPDSSVGMIFKDETLLSIGANSELTINEYVFNPDQSKFSLILKMAKGTASYVSGLIAKISPESARFITPSASIGIRGTKFVIQVDGDKGIFSW